MTDTDFRSSTEIIRLEQCDLWLPIADGPGPGFPIPVQSLVVTLHRKLWEIGLARTQVVTGMHWTVELRTTNLAYVQEWLERQHRLTTWVTSNDLHDAAYKRHAELEIGGRPFRMYGMYIELADYADTGYDETSCLVRLHADHCAWEQPAEALESQRNLSDPDPFAFRITEIIST